MDVKPWKGRFIGAMNASTIKPDDPKRQQKIEKLINDPNYVFQRKLNGERLLVYKHLAVHGQPDQTLQYNMFATGRNSSKYGPPMMKTGLVPHILLEVHAKVTGDIVLDGEVLFVPNQHSLSQDQIKSMEFTEDFWACRDVMAHHVNPIGGVKQQEADGFLHYFIFDILAYKGLELLTKSYEERLNVLNSIKPSFQDSKYVHFVDIVRTPEDKKNLMEHCLSIGLEGVVAKNLKKNYQENKRPANVWIKIKKFDPADGIVIGYSEAEQYTEVISNGRKIVGPDGKVVVAESRFYLNDWIGAIWLGQWSTNPPTRVQMKILAQLNTSTKLIKDIDGQVYYLIPVAKVSGMPDSIRAEVSMNKRKYLGSIVQFKYFEKTSDAYFHPSFMFFRDDKHENDCIWE